MKGKTNTIDISVIAPFLILIIFSVCILFALLFGTKIYKDTLNRDRTQFELRTINQYIITQIHQSDGDGMMFIGNFDEQTESSEGDTFFRIETINGTRYYTRIYCHNGYLCELFSKADGSFSKEDGEQILPLNGLNFKQNNGTVTVTITHSNGKCDVVNVSLRSCTGDTYEK